MYSNNNLIIQIECSNKLSYFYYLKYKIIVQFEWHSKL